MALLLWVALVAQSGSVMFSLSRSQQESGRRMEHLIFLRFPGVALGTTEWGRRDAITRFSGSFLLPNSTSTRKTPTPPHFGLYAIPQLEYLQGQRVGGLGVQKHVQKEKCQIQPVSSPQADRAWTWRENGMHRGSGQRTLAFLLSPHTQKNLSNTVGGSRNVLPLLT